MTHPTPLSAADSAWSKPNVGTVKSNRFALVRFNDVMLTTTSLYLIKGIFPKEGLAVVWGPPKSGKSFWLFDALMHVALGWDYRGRRVKQGPVVYVACEGERGLGARIAAFKMHHGLSDEDPDFYLVTTRLDLVGEREQLIADIKHQIRTANPVAIAFDTLNRSIRGSESSDEDMGLYINAADTVRETFGCLVIVVHHCGVDESRMRGHTSLRGALDAELSVKRDVADNVVVAVEEMKDGERGETLCSRLERVEVGRDEDGDVICSCVIVPADEAPNAKPRIQRRLNDRQTNALQALRNYFADGHGEIPPTSDHIPNGRKCVLRPDALEALENAAVAKEVAEPKRRREAIGRVLEQLQSRGVIGVYKEWLWLAE